MKEINKDLLWYVVYGSNLLESRFMCYIVGGKPDGSDKEYYGCIDKSPPQEVMSIQLDHELYFAKKSQAWQNGGVAFITSKKDGANTFCKKYLITKEQFLCVAKQETNSATDIRIDFDKTIKNAFSIFKSPSWYGKVLYLGKDEQNIPQFTLTNEADFMEFSKPSVDYLKTIARGLKEIGELSASEIVEYLWKKNGVSKTYKFVDIMQILDDKDVTENYKQLLNFLSDLSRQRQHAATDLEKEELDKDIKNAADWIYGKVNLN